MTRLNKTYLSISLVLAVSVAVCTMLSDLFVMVGVLPWVLCGYSLSRVNEVFMAFVKDVFDKLDRKKRDKNGLEYFERIQLALRSYIELIIHYALIYYLLERYCLVGEFLNKAFANLWDALYFSVVTIVQLGYGDFYPIHPLAKGLVMYEVINGTLLLVVSFTVYVSLTLKD